jgi:tRNA (guanine-N7-)-methyltransferase
MMQKLSSLRLRWPTDWAELFGAAGPLIVEIGFGYGAFLLHLARQNPGASIIGFEIANQCLKSTERAIQRAGLTNVRVIHSTAETALYHLFTPGSIQQIHINFPDPWFKKRHSRRRLIRRDILDAIVSRLESGGMFYLATDILAYAEMSAELLAATPGLTNTLTAPWSNTMPGRVITKYEGRAQREGRACYYFAYRRNQAPAPDSPVIEELEMSHIVFESPLSLDEMLAPFEASEHHSGDTHISFLQGYRGKNALLFEIFVKEPTIDQHVGLILTRRKQEGEYTLQLGTLGYPRVTRGLQKAVSLLGDWLVSLHRDARIVNSKVKREG